MVGVVEVFDRLLLGCENCPGTDCCLNVEVLRVEGGRFVMFKIGLAILTDVAGFVFCCAFDFATKWKSGLQ